MVKEDVNFRSRLKQKKNYDFENSLPEPAALNWRTPGLRHRVKAKITLPEMPVDPQPANRDSGIGNGKPVLVTRCASNSQFGFRRSPGMACCKVTTKGELLKFHPTWFLTLQFALMYFSFGFAVAVCQRWIKDRSGFAERSQGK
ncbi:hypothetical protein [Flavisolibacter nicotianae]|uniref:hypothetical protein n=1 Tax=Flavisolibacter nicotianae TaxID=2364882 RepID=UPI0013C4306A|nr:hypothetical protein [Flavisolibacter nicotianae]